MFDTILLVILGIAIFSLLAFIMIGNICKLIDIFRGGRR